MTDHIRISTEDSVMRIAFNRPDKKNAITNAMYVAMGEALARAESDPSIRAVLFEAAGSSFDDAGMIGETQVIVGTEVQDPALYDLNLCLLRAQELSFGLIEPFGSNVG